MTDSFESRIPEYRRRVEAFMLDRLPGDGVPEYLGEAVRYAASGEGKRVRPLLIYATGELLDIDASLLDAPAAAIEMIHTYSLVHDDLPAMDDDDLRRGRPTVHKQFDEATAILVGDALQTLAFQWLAEADAEPVLKSFWIATLARAAGPEGMIGGQSIDLNTESKRLDLQMLQRMHRMKSGALITATVDMASDAAPDLSPDDKDNLILFANNIGLAFQIRDDVLDVESSTEELGKPQGSDESQGRSTYVSLLGIEESKRQIRLYYERACEALSRVGGNPEGLLWLADFIVNRSK